jgi:hypothetical protein
MWAIINLLYREYCRIRIVEMRKVPLDVAVLPS